MKRLYIVEDEKMIRKGIRVIAERSGVKFEEIIEFRNGQEAYEACRKEIPDLMITDIRMPKMDGNSLVQKLKEENRLPCTIVVSGYDDFEYARNMLRCGAKDYILKPVEREKVTELLLQIEKEFVEKQLQEKQVRKLLLEKIKSGMKDGSGQEGAIETEELAAIIFEKDYRGEEVVVFCSPDILNVEESIWSFDTEDGHYFYFLGNREAEEWIESENETGGFSDGFCSIGDIYIACEDARKNRLSRYYPKGSSNLPASHTNDISQRLLEMKAAIRHIGSEEENTAKSLLKEYLHTLLHQKIGWEEWERLMHSFVQELKGFYPDILAGTEQELQKMYHFKDAGSYCDHICSILDDIKDYMQKNGEDYRNRIRVAEAVAYIKEHYASDLNMAVVSNHIGVSYNWFSSIFKQYTGINFVSYLKNFRLEEAKKLLSKTQLKIQEISSACGYENEVHFMKIFKATVGVSPSEYRKSVMVQGEIHTMKERKGR